VHLFRFIIRIYHNARSFESQINSYCKNKHATQLHSYFLNFTHLAFALAIAFGKKAEETFYILQQITLTNVAVCRIRIMINVISVVSTRHLRSSRRWSGFSRSFVTEFSRRPNTVYSERQSAS